MDMTDMTPAQHLKMVLAGAITKIEQLQKCVIKEGNILELLDGIKVLLKAIPDGQEELFIAELQDAYDTIQNRMAQFKWEIFSTYWTFTEPDLMDNLLTEEEALTSKTQDDLYSCFDVKIEVSGDILALKMPLLWSRYDNRNVGPKWGLTKENFAWFQRELEIEFSKKFDQIPTYIRRHISYLNVIPKGRKSYPDNDNYDTKKVTDIICLHMGGTDNAMTTSFSSYSWQTDEIDSGTYVIVTPNDEIAPSMGELKQTIKTMFFGL